MNRRENAYQVRHRLHEAAARDTRESRAADKRIEAHGIMREYEEAYLAANGEHIRLVYQSGWARSKAFDKPYRIADLKKLTANLWARVHEQELGT